MREEINIDDMVDIKECAKLLNLSLSRVYIMVQKKQIPCYKMNGGKKLFFSKKDLSNMFVKQ